MRPRALSPLLPLVCLPAFSFVLLPESLLLSNRGLDQARLACNWVHSRRSAGGALTATQRQGKKRRRADAEGVKSAAKSKAPSTSRAPRSWTPPNDAVSCLQNPDTGSAVWLVGIVHQATPYIELVKKTIREIRPQVVMLELDADNIFLLPAGKAQQSSNGLWWWKPEPQAGVTKKGRIKQQHRKWPKSPRSPGRDNRKEVDEIWTAGREAQACGARVLLGDRNTEVSQRREAEADRADSEMLTEISKVPGVERERLERAEKGLQMLMGLIERRRQSGFEMPETRAIVRKHSELHRLLAPREFKVVITERDEVMAKNLMALEGKHTTVAVVGSAHLDGMEDILFANGWVDAEDTTAGRRRLNEP